MFISTYIKKGRLHIHPVLDLWKNNPFIGIPYQRTTQSLWWRKKTKPLTNDPHQDNCGSLWVCFVTPFDGKTITSIINDLETMILSHGFEPNIAFFLSNTGRYCRVFIVLLYDNDIELEDKKARKCHQAIMEHIIKRGFLNNRLDTQSMDYYKRLSNDAYKLFMKKLKTTLDPKHILSPNRYEF